MRARVFWFMCSLVLFMVFIAFWRYAPLEWTTPRQDILIAFGVICTGLLTTYLATVVTNHWLAIRERNRIVTDIRFNNGNISWDEFRETFSPMMRRCGANGDESGVQVFLP